MLDSQTNITTDAPVVDLSLIKRWTYWRQQFTNKHAGKLSYWGQILPYFPWHLALYRFISLSPEKTQFFSSQFRQNSSSMAWHRGSAMGAQGMMGSCGGMKRAVNMAVFGRKMGNSVAKWETHRPELEHQNWIGFKLFLDIMALQYPS